MIVCANLKYINNYNLLLWNYYNYFVLPLTNNLNNSNDDDGSDNYKTITETTIMNSSPQIDTMFVNDYRKCEIDKVYHIKLKKYCLQLCVEDDFNLYVSFHNKGGIIKNDRL